MSDTLTIEDKKYRLEETWVIDKHMALPSSIGQNYIPTARTTLVKKAFVLIEVEDEDEL